MHQMTEHLESRTLLSATLPTAVQNDLSNLATDAQTARAAYITYGPQLANDFRSLRTAIKSAGGHGGGALLGHLNSATHRFYAVTRSDVTSLIVNGAAGVRRIAGDLIRLQMHPTQTSLQNALSRDLSMFSAKLNVFLTRLGTHGSQLGALASAELDVVTATYPSSTAVADAVNALKTDGSVFATSLGNSLTAIQTDIAAFITDAGAAS